MFRADAFKATHGSNMTLCTMKWAFFTLMLVAWLAGCATAIDQSSATAYHELIGKRVLTTDALLCKKSPFHPIDGHPFPQLAIVWQTTDKECLSGVKVAKLPKQTVVQIQRVEEHRYRNLWTYEHWYLIGSVFLEGERLEFYHFYGFTDFPESPQWQ